MEENKDRKRVLVVGAGGFVGGFLVSEALKRGYDVWAGVRETTSRKWLSDERIKFINFNFEEVHDIADKLKKTLPDGEQWDYVVYNLGATKVTSYADFSKINYEYLRNFTTALKSAGKMPDKFLYMSSLSAMGCGDEKGYTPFTETMIPMPNTKYGASKLKAEMWLAMDGIPYIIFRPTGIYGPRDHDYFLMLKSIEKGFDFSVGFRRQFLTFIYVEDLAVAVFDALEHSGIKETYNISEERSYTQGEFRKLAARTMGKKFVFPVRVPLWGLKMVSAIAEKWGVARMKPSTLNRDKYRIMKQRNWNVDVSKAKSAFGFHPATSLEEGLQKSVEWYKNEGWL